MTHYSTSLNCEDALWCNSVNSVSEKSTRPYSVLFPWLPSYGTILINMASFPSSRNAIQWAERPPQVCWSLDWTVDDDDDDATSTFSGPSSLVTSSQCTMFRASTSHSTWQRCTLRSVDGLAVNILELQRTHRFKKWIVNRHFLSTQDGIGRPGNFWCPLWI